MKDHVPNLLENGRIMDGYYGSDYTWGLNGAFEIQGPCGERLRIIATDGKDELSEGWEHVSVSTHRRTPNWREMCFVKDLFWGQEETVVQFHPPKSEYVNNHPFCLHLWRHVSLPQPMPPAIFVGIKDGTSSVA